MAPPAPSPIILIGAGVLSLTTAYTILKSNPNTQLLIIAAELPTDPPSSWTPDYASMWAGAHYRPIVPTSPQLHDEMSLALTTCDFMKQLARQDPDTGVGVLMAREYLENPGAGELGLKTGDVYASPDDGFRVLRADELPKGVRWGCEYETYCVNVTMFCQWLLHEIQRLGARVVQHRLATLRDAFALAEKLGLRGATTVVNCTGRGFCDKKTSVIRGQTVLVRQQFDKTITRQCADGAWTFLIPRPGGGGTIVGGTKEVGDWEAEVRTKTREQLLGRAAEAFPDFVNRVEQFDVLRDNVGRRPWRESGLRVEVEAVDGERRVVHGYGAGGRGYELSWGVAARVAKLVDEVKPIRASL